MGLNLFGSSSKSQTTNETLQQQATAGAGGTAVGAGSNFSSVVSVENLSADVAEDALSSITEVAGKGISGVTEIASISVRQTGDTARDALDFGEDVQARSYDFNRDFLLSTIDSQDRARTESFQLARQTAELAAAQAGVVPPASFTDQLDNQVKLIGLVGILALGFLYLNRKKS